MKRLARPVLVLSLLASCLSLSARPAAQNAKLDFTLVNKTGLTIVELYVSPAKSDEWGEDILGQDVLKNNEKVDIGFSPKARTCAWDLKIVDEDKDDVEWANLNFCEANEITLMYERASRPRSSSKHRPVVPIPGALKELLVVVLPLHSIDRPSSRASRIAARTSRRGPTAES
jgi:hypothetical protein